MRAYTPFLNEHLQLVQPFILENESFFCYVQHGEIVSMKNHYHAHVGSLLQTLKEHQIDQHVHALCQFTKEVDAVLQQSMENLIVLTASQSAQDISFRLSGLSVPLFMREEENERFLYAWIAEKEVNVTRLFLGLFLEQITELLHGSLKEAVL